MKDIEKNKEQPEINLPGLCEWIPGLAKQKLKLSFAAGLIEQQAVFLDLILDSLPNPFYVIDAFDYKIKLANSAAKFGQLSKDSTCYALTHKRDKPCDSAEHPCPVEEIKKTKQPFTVEHVHYDKDRNIQHVEINAFPVFDSNGNLSQIIIYAVDITARKQAEENLKRELAINAALSECYTPLVSPKASIEEMVGQIALANKEDDYTYRDLEAIRRLAQFYALAIQRKRAEEALEKSHNELEKRVKERTAELTKSYKEQAFIREIFGTYLSDDIASEILASPEDVTLKGEIREMSVLVSDLRGFTSATESMEPHHIVKLLNRYLEKMVDIIMRHEGTIDEFVGDGILVFFGAPRLLQDHSNRAVACALKMQEDMNVVNAGNLRLGLPQLEMGIGINCGQLVVGNIGSKKRKKYGAVGSPINIAFRLAEKTRPGEILITQVVKEKLSEMVRISSFWKDNLKGFGKTDIYSVIGRDEN